MNPCPCGMAGELSGTSCDVCETYLCLVCQRWVPWSDGAADEQDDVCDECTAIVGACIRCGAPCDATRCDDCPAPDDSPPTAEERAALARIGEGETHGEMVCLGQRGEWLHLGVIGGATERGPLYTWRGEPLPLDRFAAVVNHAPDDAVERLRWTVQAWARDFSRYYSGWGPTLAAALEDLREELATASAIHHQIATRSGVS